MRRDRKAVLNFLKKIIKRYGKPKSIVTDKLPSYRAALRNINMVKSLETGRWINNCAENFYLPFRRLEHTLLKFRLRQTMKKFSSIHSSVDNHFNQERYLTSRDNFKFQRNAALAEWRELYAA